MGKSQSKHLPIKKPSFNTILQLLGIYVALCVGIAYKISTSHNPQNQDLFQSQETTINYALIGDIGGTNIRFQLISFTSQQNLPLLIIKEQRLKVTDFETFQDSINHFLSDVLETYPQVAVIAIAGPVSQNTVVMPNIPKWGTLDGNKLAPLYNISSFLIINDFQAASYGLLIIQEDQLIKLNGMDANPRKTRGVIGPGTGLGHSTIFYNEIAGSFIILPSEAGHSDVPYIDHETSEYVEFLRTKQRQPIDLQKTFCGPSIPEIFQFYSKKLNPDAQFIAKNSPEIVQECIKERPELIYQKVFGLFMKFYSAAIANFMIQHMTTGGVYLVGGLSNALISKIEGRDILKEWKERHPEMKAVVQKIPLIFSKEIDLGLKGSFYVARKITIQRQNKALATQDIF